MPEAEEALRTALAHREKWAGEHPGSERNHEGLARSSPIKVSSSTRRAGRGSRPTSTAVRSACTRDWRPAARQRLAQVEVAWWLAICPAPQLRDPDRAVVLARKAVKLEPTDAIHGGCSARAVRQARLVGGDRGAGEGHRARPGRGGRPALPGHGHWRRGEPALARSYYEKAVGVIDRQRGRGTRSCAASAPRRRPCWG